MTKSIFIISTSPRKGGNSDLLAQAFFRGAQDAGHHVEKVCLYDKEIRFCTGCLACIRTHRCVLDDDARCIAEKMGAADVLVFATPVYYYEMSGQMKTMLDRANPLYGSEYRFREVYLLCAAAEDRADVSQRAQSGLEGWIECFPRARLAASVFAGGVDGIGAIEGHPALKKAYELGGLALAWGGWKDDETFFRGSLLPAADFSGCLPRRRGFTAHYGPRGKHFQTTLKRREGRSGQTNPDNGWQRRGDRIHPE